MNRRSPHRLAAAAGVVSVALLLGACSGDDEPSPDPSPSPTAGAGGDEGEPPVELGEDGLPVDFPRDDVPLVDETLVSVNSPTERNPSFSLLYYAGDRAPTELLTAAVGLLEDAGWSASTQIEGEPPGPQILTNPDTEASRIILVTGAQQGETTISYSVILEE